MPFSDQRQLKSAVKNNSHQIACPLIAFWKTNKKMINSSSSRANKWLFHQKNTIPAKRPTCEPHCKNIRYKVLS